MRGRSFQEQILRRGQEILKIVKRDITRCERESLFVITFTAKGFVSNLREGCVESLSASKKRQESITNYARGYKGKFDFLSHTT